MKGGKMGKTKHYNSGGKYTGYSTHGHSNCCYVTTACLDSMGLPRDSLEMKAMKELTTEHILKSLQGKKDYVSYQRIGPSIVEAVESRSNAREIWEEVYGALKSVTSAVFSGRYEDAHQKYKELMLDLKKQFVK